MSREISTIKNDEVYRQINKKTNGDPVMREFLTTVVNMGSIFSFKKKYNEAIDKALADKEYMHEIHDDTDEKLQAVQGCHI